MPWPHLLENLTSTNPVARREAAKLLERLQRPVPKAVPALKTLLKDDYQDTRLAAIGALGCQGTPAIKLLLDHLERVSREPDVDEAHAVAEAFRRFSSDARAILPLLVPYLDASKHHGIVIDCVLTTVERLGYARDTPEENFDSVLPALARLVRQGKGEYKKKVPESCVIRAEELLARVDFRKKRMTTAPK